MGTYEKTFVVDGLRYELFVSPDGGYTLLDAGGEVVNHEPLTSAPLARARTTSIRGLSPFRQRATPEHWKSDDLA